MQSISLKLPEDLMSRLNDEAHLRQINKVAGDSREPRDVIVSFCEDQFPFML